MSSNRLMYDVDETQHKLGENNGTLEYLLQPHKFYNNNNCMISRGIIGGNAVGQIDGNLVDLESDLFGVTRKASLAPNDKFLSKCAIGDLNNCKPNNILIKGTPNTKERIINTNIRPLPSCNMINYKPLVFPEEILLDSCSIKK